MEQAAIARDPASIAEDTEPDVYLRLTSFGYDPDHRDSPLTAFKSIREYEASASGDPSDLRFKSAQPVPPDIPVIRGVGSTSMEDVDGDVFHPEAIREMVGKSVDLNVLLGHLKVPPDNQFGGVFESAHRMVKGPDGKTYAGVELGIDLQVDNPPAVKTYEFMTGKNARPRQYGLSVGACYTKVSRRFNKTLNTYHGLDVKGCTPVEYTVTPLPANRAAWIEMVTKSLKRKGVLPADAPEKWLDDEVQYRLVHRDDFDDVDWRNLSIVARHLEKAHGIVLCRPQLF